MLNNVMRIAYYMRLWKLIQSFLPQKIDNAIDLGGGTGAFLRALELVNTNCSIKVVDIQDYKEDIFWIEEGKYFKLDLNLPANFENESKYDVACSLENAEHLTPEASDQLISDLCSLSDVVIFSAAIPNQGGNGHINEQPLSYWVKKFDKNEYVLKDCLRSIIWDDIRIPYWYRQNMVLFVNSVVLGKYPKLYHHVNEDPIDRTHPELFYLFKEFV